MNNLRQKSLKYHVSIKEKSCKNIVEDFWIGVKMFAISVITRFFKHPETVPTKHIPQKYAYIFRTKSWWELFLLSASVCGVQFCFAAEQAFVTPLLLNLGMEMKYVSMVWCLSPPIGILLIPLLGSMSDVCSSKLGRRRPFIIGLSVFILIGLVLVPFGKQLGITLGDMPFSNNLTSNRDKKIDDFRIVQFFKESSHGIKSSFVSDASDDHNAHIHDSKTGELSHKNIYFSEAPVEATSLQYGLLLKEKVENQTAPTENSSKNTYSNTLLLRSVVFTVLGTIFIDSSCAIFVSPSRAYMLDVTLPKDHATGLSTFSLMSGLGAGLANVVGAIQWNVPDVLGNGLEGQVIIVFAIISVVFVICVISSLCSFPELPLWVFKDPEAHKEYKERYFDTLEKIDINQKESIMITRLDADTKRNYDTPEIVLDAKNAEKGIQSHFNDVSLKGHLMSIIRMPKSLFCLCLVNFFTWMTLTNYSFYFTTFMGEYVYGGSPHAEHNSTEYILFKDGVRYACWGKAISSVFVVFHCLFLERVMKRFGIKFVYIGGHVIGSIGLLIMVTFKNSLIAIILSAVNGIVYGAAVTIPYLLVARYHSHGMEAYSSRGIGTDVATVTSTVELSQFLVSLTIGSIAEALGSSAVTMGSAAVASGCAALLAFFVTYPEAKQTS